jgi:hypothetical protein
LTHILRQFVEPLAGVLQTVVVADTPVKEDRENPPMGPSRVQILVFSCGLLDFSDSKCMYEFVGVGFQQQAKAARSFFVD